MEVNIDLIEMIDYYEMIIAMVMRDELRLLSASFFVQRLIANYAALIT
jgi:hypothetical protein